jgi:hypothetical protein
MPTPVIAVLNPTLLCLSPTLEAAQGNPGCIWPLAGTVSELFSTLGFSSLLSAALKPALDLAEKYFLLRNATQRLHFLPAVS